MSGIWLPDGSKLVKNWKNDRDITICEHESLLDFFFTVSLVKFSYRSRFHVNIITGLILDSRVVAISLYKKLTGNLEIGNTPYFVYLFHYAVY